MTGQLTLISKLRKLLAEDPRSAIALLEILGPPPGLQTARSADRTPTLTD